MWQRKLQTLLFLFLLYLLFWVVSCWSLIPTALSQKHLDYTKAQWSLSIKVKWKRREKITEMDAQGHGHSVVSHSLEAQIWDHQSKPHEKTLTWLILSRAVARACCWGIVQPKPTSQRHSMRAWATQHCHSHHWGQNVFPSFFLLK